MSTSSQSSSIRAMWYSSVPMLFGAPGGCSSSIASVTSSSSRSVSTPAVVERREPAPHLGGVGDRLQDQQLAFGHGGKATPCCAARLLPRVAQPGCDAVHRGLHEAFRPPPSVEEPQLQERERVDVGVAQLDRLLQLRAGSRGARGCPATASTSSVVRAISSRIAAREVVAVPAREVQLGDRGVGLRERQLRVLDQRREERPARGTSLAGSRARRARRPPRRGRPPARTSPGRFTRLWPHANTHGIARRSSRSSASADAARHGPRGDRQRRDLRDRRHPPEEAHEARGSHERLVPVRATPRPSRSTSSPNRSAGSGSPSAARRPAPPRS